MTSLTLDPETRRRPEIRWPDGQWRPVDGCRWCGHTYEPPTEAQRAARAAANDRISLLHRLRAALEAL